MSKVVRRKYKKLEIRGGAQVPAWTRYLKKRARVVPLRIKGVAISTAQKFARRVYGTKADSIGLKSDDLQLSEKLDGPVVEIGPGKELRPAFARQSAATNSQFHCLQALEPDGVGSADLHVASGAFQDGKKSGIGGQWQNQVRQLLDEADLLVSVSASAPQLDPVPSSASQIDLLTSLLARLRARRGDVSASCQAVLDLETFDVPREQRPEVCGLLREFIARHRNANVPDTLVVVNAAIRKFVAYLPESRLADLAELLQPGPRGGVPIDVELEVAKTLVRRLSVVPPDRDNGEPVLASCLADIAATYIRPRLLNREMYGATALNVLLSLLLLRTGQVEDLVEFVKSAQTPWFAQLACRRVSKLIADLSARESTAICERSTSELRSFLARIEGQS